MATSGSKTIAATSYDDLKFSWSASQSVADNTSTITWKLELISKSSGKIKSSVEKNWSVTVAGQTFSGKNSIAIENNTTKTLASGTTNPIAHNSDGTKSFSYSFSQQLDINFGGTWIGTKSGSGSGTLDTIARKSSVYVTGGTLGTPLTLSVLRQSSSFTHTIKYECGTATGTICTKSSSISIEWNEDKGNTVALAAQNKTGTSVPVTFTITTYNGNTSIGTFSKTVTMSIPETVKPSCTVTVTDTQGYKNVYGKAIKGLSKLQIKVNPTLAQGSSISAYRVAVNGATYTAQTTTTDVLKSSGDLVVTAQVTDRRGRSGRCEHIEEVLDYSPPKITRLSVVRCDYATGNENDQGKAIKATFSCSVTSLNYANTMSANLYYKKSTETTYSKIDLAQEGYLGIEIVDGSVVFSADSEFSYDVKLVVEDNFQEVSHVTSASTAYTLMDFGADGKSVAFGKVAEISNTLDVGFRLRTYGGILQPVLEDGADFDKLLTPNTYTLKNAVSAGYTNGPADFVGTSSTGVLRIESCGEAGQLRQVLTLCNSPKPQEYERYYYINGSSMSWYNWKRKFEVELYNNSNGSNGTITLNETSANFKYIEIFFTDNQGYSGGYTKVYSPNGKTVCLSIVEAAASSYTLIRRTNYTVSATTITPNTTLAGYGRLKGNAVDYSTGTNYIKIKRVIGYE